MFPSSKIIRKICQNGKATVPFPWSPQGGLGKRFPNSLSDDTSKNNMSFPSKNWYEKLFLFLFCRWSDFEVSECSREISSSFSLDSF